MTGCGTERYADWFFDLDGTLAVSYTHLTLPTMRNV